MKKNTTKTVYTLTWEYDGVEMKPEFFLDYHKDEGLEETLEEFIKESLIGAGGRNVQLNDKFSTISVKHTLEELPESFTTSIGVASPEGGVDYHTYTFFLEQNPQQEKSTTMSQTGGELLKGEVSIQWKVDGVPTDSQEIYRLALNSQEGEELEEDYDFGLLQEGFIRAKLDDTYDFINVYYNGNGPPIVSLPAPYTFPLHVFVEEDENAEETNEDETEEKQITVEFVEFSPRPTERNNRLNRFGLHHGYHGISYSVGGIEKTFDELNLTQAEKLSLQEQIYARVIGTLMMDGIDDQTSLNDSFTRIYVHFDIRPPVVHTYIAPFSFAREGKPPVQVSFDDYRETNEWQGNNNSNNNNNNNSNNNDDNNNNSNRIPEPENEPQPFTPEINTTVTNPTGGRKRNKRTRRAGTRLRKSRSSHVKKRFRRKTLRRK